jgi:hypothetical protein
MKPVRWVVSAALVLLPAAALLTAAADRPRSVGMLETFAGAARVRAGLDKLSEDERDALEAVVFEAPAIDRVQTSAEQFLLREGWEVIALYGAFKSRDDRRIHQFAVLGPIAYVIRPSFTGETLLPGFYLVKKMGSTMDILGPDGDKVGYWVEEEL